MKTAFQNIKIIYASASGNTLEVANYIRQRLLDEGYDATIQRAELTEGDKLVKRSLYIFTVSTWEHGMINPHFDDLLEYFRNYKNSLTASFVGLGDLRYEPVQFCGGMKQLKDAVINGGGKEFISALRINGDPYGQLETLVENWVSNLLNELKHEE